MSKHTPGPWTVVKNEHSEGWRLEAEIDLAGAPRLGVIGHFQSQVCHDTFIGTAGAEANAKLAAAAPDLLAALEAISTMMCADACGEDDVCPECPASNDAEHDALVDAVMLARAAIAQAKERESSS